MFGKKLRRRLPMLTVAVVVVVAGSSAAATGARGSSRQLATFTVHGSYVWRVPAGVTKVTFDVFGASGGNTTDASGRVLIGPGGAGGEAKAQFAVKPGEMFEIVVGGRGADGSTINAIHGGGFNGGGTALNSASGGGGSDVRLAGHGNPCASARACGYPDRIVVGGGGGGGGGGCSGSAPDRHGGVGGGLSGTDPNGGALFGTQEAGGQGADPGGFGYGGQQTLANVHDCGGGGGGGWYGGGCCVFVSGRDDSGGGGGSGFTSPFARTASFPGGTHGGDGLVTVTTP
jgi:hypothetical protein